MIMVSYAYIYTNAWTCAKTNQSTWCWRLLLMPCFTQMLNVSAMLVPCVICPRPSSLSMIDSSSHDFGSIETYEIEDHFPHFDPYAWWIPCFRCLGSELSRRVSAKTWSNVSVDWIVIDANMGLAVAPQTVIDATKSLLQCISMDDPSALKPL